MLIEKLYFKFTELVEELECCYQDVDKFVNISGVKIKNTKERKARNKRVKKVKASDLERIRLTMLLMNKSKMELLVDVYHHRTKEDIVKELLKVKYS